MFLRPFLKYFKPFLHRLAVAIIGTIIVGALSAAPLIIAREVIQVLLYNKPALMGQLETATNLSSSQKKMLAAIMKGEGADAQETGDTRSAVRRLAAQSGLTLAQIEASSQFTTEEKVSLRKYLKAEAPATTATQAVADGTESIDQAVTSLMERKLGSAWTGPRDWAKATAARIKAPWTRLHAYYEGIAKASPLKALGFLVLIFMLMTIVKGVADYTAEYQLAYTFFFTNLHMREDIFHNVLRQDYLYFSRHSTGYLHSRINSDVKEMKNILDGLLSDGIQQPVTLICVFAILIWLSPQLTMGVMTILPVIGLLLYYFARVLRKNTKQQKKKSDELSSNLTESLNNIRLVKAFGTEKLEIGKFHDRSIELFRYMMARRIAKFGSSPLMEFIGAIAASGVIMFGGWMILGTPPRMTFPSFFIYLMTLSRFYRPIKQLAGLTNKYQIAQVSADRMIEMLNLQPKLKEIANPVPFNQLNDSIEFRNIGFSYSGARVLDGINIHVKKGQKIAFAGPSGAGKTTMVNLLVRLFDPSEGAVVVDGIDLKNYSVKDWREHLAIVTQDTFLFDETIAYNIAYGSPVADGKKIEAAARAANAYDFIMALDGGKGFKTVLGPMGNRLSGGQRQRIAIARAIYRDPKILVLDEATSALDSKSQAAVQEALGHLMEGRTTFIVAHRISTIRDVDCIYVLDAGNIAEAGSHDELVARGGLYAAMVDRTAQAPSAAETPAPAGGGRGAPFIGIAPDITFT